MRADQIGLIAQLKSEGKTFVEIAAQVGLEIGDVQTAVNIVEIVAQGGTNGLPRKVEFPFAYDTPGLTGGVVVYRPKVDDLLLDAWIEVSEAWDGTTPSADIGTFVGSVHGLWTDPATANALLTLVAAQDTGGLRVSPSPPNLGLAALLPGGRPRFISEDPLKLVVSQDGTSGGASPASTQGAGILRLLVL